MTKAFMKIYAKSKKKKKKNGDTFDELYKINTYTLMY